MEGAVAADEVNFNAILEEIGGDEVDVIDTDGRRQRILGTILRVENDVMVNNEMLHLCQLIGQAMETARYITPDYLRGLHDLTTRYWEKRRKKKRRKFGNRRQQGKVHEAAVLVIRD